MYANADNVHSFRFNYSAIPANPLIIVLEAPSPLTQNTGENAYSGTDDLDIVDSVTDPGGRGMPPPPGL